MDASEKAPVSVWDILLEAVSSDPSSVDSVFDKHVATYQKKAKECKTKGDEKGWAWWSGRIQGVSEVIKYLEDVRKQ